MQDILPTWHALVKDDSAWGFSQGKLIHGEYQRKSYVPPKKNGLHRFLVKSVWAAQKHSPSVNAVLGRLKANLSETGWGLNLGAGETKLHDRILNLDVFLADHIDVVNQGTRLPFRDNSLDLVISQEVLEHVDDPFCYISEAQRVLKPGGVFYCQLPFIIGYHPGPTDFWRFTRESYAKMFDAPQWEIVELDLSLGHGSGFYRILVEFMAVTASIVHRRLYLPAKGLSSVLFSPLQLLDRLTKYSHEKDRIPGGYYCIAKKCASC